jgi:hypothetical protein
MSKKKKQQASKQANGKKLIKDNVIINRKTDVPFSPFPSSLSLGFFSSSIPPDMEGRQEGVSNQSFCAGCCMLVSFDVGWIGFFAETFVGNFGVWL